MEAPQSEQNNALEPPEAPLRNMVEPTASSVGQLWGAAARTLTRLFGLVKHVLLVYLVIVMLRNAISESFPEISCGLTVLSRYFPHCTHEVNPPGRPINPDFFTLAQLQSRLEYVMEDSASNSLVAANIKCSEMALRDLVTLVQLSSLARKNTLQEEVKHSVNDAQAASGDLQEFSSRVWASVDRIIPLNEHTLMTLESGKSFEILGFFYGIINGLIPIEWDAAATHRKRMEDLWLQAVELLDKTLRELIHQAQHNVGSLQRLKERLNNLQDMVAKEEHEICHEEEILQLMKTIESLLNWWQPGPPPVKVPLRSNDRKLLQMVHDHRQRALDHTMGALFKLEQMSKDLHILRGEVSTPIIAPGPFKIPIEAHIKSIRHATERLVYGQVHMREIENANRQKRFCSS